MRRSRMFLAMTVAAASLVLAGCAQPAPTESADHLGLRVAQILEVTRDALGDGYFSFYHFGPSECQVRDGGADGVFWKVVLTNPEAAALTDDQIHYLTEKWDGLGLDVTVDRTGIGDGVLELKGTPADPDAAYIEAQVSVITSGGSRGNASIISSCVPGNIEDFAGEN
ncbi:MAG: hypothetical protein ABI435_08985 [Pseudolysinimonas sp.]